MISKATAQCQKTLCKDEEQIKTNFSMAYVYLLNNCKSKKLSINVGRYSCFCALTVILQVIFELMLRFFDES